MKKIMLIGALITASVVVYGNSDVEIPLYKLQKMNYNDSDKSSKPELLMRQFEYKSTASTKELIEFYNESSHIKSCEYNELADNHRCHLSKHGKVSSGSIFISSKPRNGLTAVFADYFYFK